MSARGPSLASGAAAGQTSPVHRGQSPARPGRDVSAASGPKPRPRPLRNQKPRHRVVTQQNFFPGPICDRPGCYEPPVTSPRNRARYCGPACRHAVHNVLDRERKWLFRGTLDGRKKRAFEYKAARRRRPPPRPKPLPQHRASTSRITASPDRAGRQLSRAPGRQITLGIVVTSRSPSMIQKRVLVPSRLRRPPATGWSWVDRRFLREYAERLSREAVLLYFFSDRRGRPKRAVVLW